MAIKRRQVFVDCSDIIAEVRAMRDERIRLNPPPAPPPELLDDPEAYREHLRESVRAVADGKPERRAIGGQSERDLDRGCHRAAARHPGRDGRLGSMMLSDPVLADCLRMLKPAAFFRPGTSAHLRGVLVAGRGGQACRLADREGRTGALGTIGQAGGPLYLHDCLKPSRPRRTGRTTPPSCLSTSRSGNWGPWPRASRKWLRLRTEPPERAEAARSALEDVLAPAASTGLRDICEIMVDVIGTLERGEIRGVTTGWSTWTS